jgi:hypothetical protein
MEAVKERIFLHAVNTVQYIRTGYGKQRVSDALGLLNIIVSERRKKWRKVLGMIVMKVFRTTTAFASCQNVGKGDAF